MTGPIYRDLVRTAALAGLALLVVPAASVVGTAGVGLAAERREPAFAVASASDNPVLVWDNAILQGIRTIKPGPTVAARALAVAHTAMFDAWSAYDGAAVPTILRPAWRRPPAERTTRAPTLGAALGGLARQDASLLAGCQLPDRRADLPAGESLAARTAPSRTYQAPFARALGNLARSEFHLRASESFDKGEQRFAKTPAICKCSNPGCEVTSPKPFSTPKEDLWRTC